ncbi:hypothetical protein Q8A67_023238 [Cirrhinus molitorella]|uniref:SGNH hydrolase-type esterase domain-containing protein n=1 Tax=Cirrhinus molitorella TaxID=172907 RepID=A0AA88TB23_9TELE|nr:hypothetical protein Q8A67_023238 [Cirrhinus molitorella]
MQPTKRTCPVLLAISVITGSSCTQCRWSWRLWRSRFAGSWRGRPEAESSSGILSGVLHSGAGTPRTLGAAAAEDASQATDEDLSPPGLRDLHPELLRSPPRDRTRHCDRRFHRQIPAILKDESISAIVLHAGVNDIRLRQTEVLKRDFSSLIETSRSRTAAGQRLQDAALHLTSYSSRV